MTTPIRKKLELSLAERKSTDQKTPQPDVPDLDFSSEEMQVKLSRLSVYSDLALQAQSKRTLNFTRRMTAKSRKSASLPPEIETTPILSWRFRFMVTTGGPYTITSAQLISIAGMTVTGLNTTMVSHYTVTRIRRITIWPDLSTTGATVPNVDWFGAVGNVVTEVVKDRTLPAGQTNERALVTSPPRGTLIHGVYLNGSFGNICTISAGTGSIVDVEASFMGRSSQTNVSQGISTGAVGTIYYPALDGTASNKIVPTSLNTTH
jgi:hypothetical protein